MSLIQKFRDKMKERRDRKKLPSIGVSSISETGPPVIDTPWGATTESARLRAALNMKDDPALKSKVEALLARQKGSMEAGVAESKRRYPECYEDEK
jgi:hypothetical protein